MTQDEKDDAGSPTREVAQPEHTVMIEIPRELGAYRLSKLLGRGGMGEVWQALDTQLEREVAIKLMRKELSENADAARRFTREARAVARLNHPNIVQVYAFGDEKGLNYFVMELVEGETVSQCLKRRKKLSVEDTISIMLQAIEGLGYANARGIIHRDIKPSNLMLTEDGRVKIADFGLAKMIEHDTQMTAAGTAMGSPNYMSPEQARGEEADHRSDIYALGVSMFQMLCGDLPFTASSPVAVLLKQIQDPLPEHDLIKCIHDGAALAVLKKMTEKRPEARHQSYAELATALTALAPEYRRTSSYLPTGTMPAASDRSGPDFESTETDNRRGDSTTLNDGNPESSLPPTVPPMKTHPKLARIHEPSPGPELEGLGKVRPKSNKALVAAGAIALVLILTASWIILRPDTDIGTVDSNSNPQANITEASNSTPTQGSAVTNSPPSVRPVPASPSPSPARPPAFSNSNQAVTITALVTPVATAAPGAASGFTPTPSTGSLMPDALRSDATPATSSPKTVVLGLDGAPAGTMVPLYVDSTAQRIYKQMPAGTEVTVHRDGTSMMSVIPANEKRPYFVYKGMTRPKP